jgi:hypothetical protein
MPPVGAAATPPLGGDSLPASAGVVARVTPTGSQASGGSCTPFRATSGSARGPRHGGIEVAPGAEAQVDFGYAGQFLDPDRGQLRKTWAFVMTLYPAQELEGVLVAPQPRGDLLVEHEFAVLVAAVGPPAASSRTICGQRSSTQPCMIPRSSAPTASSPNTTASSSRPVGPGRPSTRARSNKGASTTSSATRSPAAPRTTRPRTG